jgi:hypothetical protein
MTKEGKEKRKDDLLAVASALERLALAIREEAGQERQGSGESGGAVPNEPAVRVGQRVRVTIADRYRGRTGTIVSAHGQQFWDIRLDPVDGGISTVIYKKASSFAVIEN